MGPLFDTSPVEATLASFLAFDFASLNLTPEICIASKVERHSHREALHTHQHNIRATRGAVAILEQQIATLARTLDSWNAAAVAACAPVSGLPTELLQEIFLLVVADNTSPGVRFTLSHVSSRWREVSLGLHELWRVIDLRHRARVGVFRMFARRAGALRLGLYLDNTWTPSLVYLGLEPEDAARLSKLSLKTSSPPERFMSSLERNAHVVQLDELVLLSDGSRSNQLLSWMCSTKSLDVSGFVSSPFVNIRMDRLTSLHMSNTWPWNVTEVLEQLGSLPALRNLDLRDMKAGHINIDLKGLNRQLTTLTMVSCPTEVTSHVLREMPMPNLVSLTLCPHMYDEDEDAGLLRTLRCLCTTSPKLEILNITTSSQALPSVSYILDPGHSLTKNMHTISVSVSLLPGSPTLDDELKGRCRDFIGVIELRSSGLTRLRHLTVQKRFVTSTEDEQVLRRCVGILTLWAESQC